MHAIICLQQQGIQDRRGRYADILKQLRDIDFEKQLHERLELAEQNKRSAVELGQARVANEFQKATVAEVSEIQKLKARLEPCEISRKVVGAEAVPAIEKEQDELKNGLDRVALEKRRAESALKDKYETQLKDREEAIERLGA